MPNEHESVNRPPPDTPSPSPPQPGWQAPPSGPGQTVSVPPPPRPPPPDPAPYPQGAYPQGAYPPQGACPQGAYPPQYPVPPSTNGLAIASLVLGILWLYWLGSILALIFGYVARRQIDTSHGASNGRGLATAGVVLGWIGIGVLLEAASKPHTATANPRTVGIGRGAQRGHLSWSAEVTRTAFMFQPTHT